MMVLNCLTELSYEKLTDSQPASSSKGPNQDDARGQVLGLNKHDSVHT